MTQLRIGQGIDVHRYAPGRKLVLGGVEIPSDIGLLGHSDADVVLHALCDALLGALGLGDIGVWFPDTSAEHKDRSSLEFLEIIMERLALDEWSVVNADITVLAEKPRIMPHAERIRETLAGGLKVETSRVSLKATTAERLGFIGREEGMLASAVVLLQQTTKKEAE